MSRAELTEDPGTACSPEPSFSGGIHAAWRYDAYGNRTDETQAAGTGDALATRTDFDDACRATGYHGPLRPGSTGPRAEARLVSNDNDEATAIYADNPAGEGEIRAFDFAYTLCGELRRAADTIFMTTG